MKATIIILGTLSALPALLSGQSLSPVPVVASDSDVFRFPGTQPIFLNPAVPEYVVALRTPDGQVQRMLHAPLHNGAMPKVSSTVSRDADGMFHYTYSVSNGPAAHASIQRWALATEEMNGTLDLKHPEWASGQIAPTSGVIRDRNRAFGWKSKIDGIAAGQTVAGFEIVSNLAPGYVAGIFYSAPPTAELSPDDWASMPEDIANQLHKLLATNWDSQTLQIVGPAFAPGASVAMIEDNFFAAINLMKSLGTLPNGIVTTELYPRLLAALRGDEPMSVLQLDSFMKPGRPLVPKELEVVSTLKMSMDSVGNK